MALKRSLPAKKLVTSVKMRTRFIADRHGIGRVSKATEAGRGA